LRERLESHHLASAVRIIEPGESLDVNADGTTPGVTQ
jgi:hypothetical protein